ncbi:DNA phosphorothioation-dependent restriction protein DptG [Pedobacter aquatilis]|uniref:DNA phosphorothioation-dependent restriction protein DptG n=1 Tax=Pedobacter aquatilis TaxID=351343 RepID=UPI0025B2B4A2|nr:DNA phosphorothioation-dependent restriction protein DptG [Pedobacter aquatilis]MDN3586104.1 DNA phosphorothioation-dependent restriction protein DptG [Pedobacter aquatilis]
MGFTRNQSRYKAAFKDDFTHSSGKTIRLFPYTSTVENLPKILPDLKNFRGVTGRFCRNCLATSQSKAVSKATMIKDVNAIVSSEEPQKLADIISSLFFDDKGSILLFSHRVLPFLTANNTSQQNITIESFIANLLIDHEVIKILKDKISQDDQSNVLHSLVLDQLASLSEDEQVTQEDENYYQGHVAKDVLALFKVDLSALAKSDKLFSSKLGSLLQYYYFIYIIRLSDRLNNFFDLDAKPLKLFYSLEWEKLSKSRLAIENGWHLLKNTTAALFAHSNCIEMLNTIDIDPKYGLSSCFIYDDLTPIIAQLNDRDDAELIRTLTKFVDEYKENFNKRILIADFESNYCVPEWFEGKKAPFKLIHELFSLMKFQFENNTTRPAYNSFSSYFTEFARTNFFKTRGSLSGSLKIDKDTLLLFTELSIISSGKDKILISQLWHDLEKRDILFDNISKKEAIAFFEKINLLEKKSDSGDAQFVKRLYK